MDGIPSLEGATITAILVKDKDGTYGIPALQTMAGVIPLVMLKPDNVILHCFEEMAESIQHEKGRKERILLVQFENMKILKEINGKTKKEETK